MKRILIILISLFILTGCMVRVKTNEELINEAVIEVNAPKELTVTSRITYDLADLLLSINNNTKEYIYKLNIDSTYLDDKGNTIKTTHNSYDYIEPSSRIVGFSILPKNDNYESYIPAKIKVDITVEEGSVPETYNKDIETGYSIKDGEITVNAVNKSKKALKELNMVILFMNEDKMVHYNEVIVDKIKANEIVQEKRPIPTDLKYDDIEIIVNSAY